ncbi:MAG: hypothetical protein OEY44_01880 [Candidatus Peregrinibacteria bacterium]|nr:hypothetical protein [Candidatus Peregrinibacteria bacterium]
MSISKPTSEHIGPTEVVDSLVDNGNQLAEGLRERITRMFENKEVVWIGRSDGGWDMGRIRHIGGTCVVAWLSDKDGSLLNKPVSAETLVDWQDQRHDGERDPEKERWTMQRIEELERLGVLGSIIKMANQKREVQIQREDGQVVIGWIDRIEIRRFRALVKWRVGDKTFRKTVNMETLLDWQGEVSTLTPA